MEKIVIGLLMIVGGILILVICFLPTIIAFNRGHHYRWIICAINVVFGATGIGYLAALVWSLWPKNTAVADVIINDPTTNSPAANQKIYDRYAANLKTLTSPSQPPDVSGVTVYIQKGSQRFGPISLKEADSRVRSGQFELTDLVWTEGQKEWVSLEKMLCSYGLQPPPV